jgi:hypothetical protein
MTAYFHGMVLPCEQAGLNLRHIHTIKEDYTTYYVMDNHDINISLLWSEKN